MGKSSYTTNIKEELKRFNSILRYINEQAEPQPDDQMPPPPPPAPGDEQPAGETLPPLPTDSPDTGSTDVGGLPPLPQDTTTPPPPLDSTTQTAQDTGGEGESVEEIDVTELVNITKSLKKEIDANKQNGSEQKMTDIFSKLTDLENKLSDMNNVIQKIDELGRKIETMKPPTPVEKLEMRSLDSFPFNQKPNEFFNEKKEQMRASGKNEYVLTKDDIQNYGKNEIRRSFSEPLVDNDNLF